MKTWLLSPVADGFLQHRPALALPEAYRRARGKRLRLAFLNIAARLTRHERQLQLRFGAAYPHLHAFDEALHKIRALPAFG